MLGTATTAARIAPIGLALCLVCSIYRVDAAEPSILGLPERGMANKGTVFLLGGGKPTELVYDEFLRLAGGKKARVVLITSAYPYRDLEHIEGRFGGWRKMGAESLTFLDAKSREEADSPTFIKPLARATAVWLAGGSQNRLMRMCGNTRTARAVRDVFNRGGVVGGTSAGASAMSEVMICSGTTKAELGEGLGLLSNAVVDQHFSQRSRYGRLLEAVAQHPEEIGIGIDERTAAIIQGNSLRVIGESLVTVCLPLKDQATMVYRLKSGQQADFGALTRGLALANKGK